MGASAAPALDEAGEREVLAHRVTLRAAAGERAREGSTRGVACAREGNDGKMLATWKP